MIHERGTMIYVGHMHLKNGITVLSSQNLHHDEIYRRVLPEEKYRQGDEVLVVSDVKVVF